MGSMPSAVASSLRIFAGRVSGVTGTNRVSEPNGINHMARMVKCVKFGREAEGLDFPPYPGELGKRIFENVSK